jgi:transcriptional regulator with XRE-family HTH domain
MYKGRISNVAQRLSQALATKRIKQIELCKMLEIPKGAMSHYLSGKYEPRQSRLNEMAIALNVSEAWLMGYDVPMERPIGQQAELNLQLFAENESPDENNLTEGEKEFLNLFRMLPEEEQRIYLEMLRARLNARTKGQAQS